MTTPDALRRALIGASALVGEIASGARGFEPEDRASLAFHLAVPLTCRSRLDRATVLGSVRHELRLPLGADAVRPGQPYLESASDSSVVVAATRCPRSGFRGLLLVHDEPEGSVGAYRVEPGDRFGATAHDLRLLRHLRATIARAVHEVDPHALVESRWEPGEAG